MQFQKVSEGLTKLPYSYKSEWNVSLLLFDVEAGLTQRKKVNKKHKSNFGPSSPACDKALS